MKPTCVTCVKSPFFDWSLINRNIDFGALYDIKENQVLSEDKLERGIKPLYFLREKGYIMWMIFLK